MYSLDRLLKNRNGEKNVRYRRQRFTGSIWTEIMLRGLWAQQFEKCLQGQTSALYLWSIYWNCIGLKSFFQVTPDKITCLFCKS